MLYTSSVNSFYVKPKYVLGSLDISKETSNTFNRFIETYTRIFSGFCLVATTKGYTLRHFDCMKQPRYVISP